jgi:hypothetical protein
MVMVLLSNSQKDSYTYSHMKNKKCTPRIIKSFVSVLILLCSVKASAAFLTLSESAELISEGHYRLGVAPQLRLSDGNGFNAGFYADGFISDDMNWRGLIGGGTTDFFMQGSVKWVPVPDYDKQPALGGRLMVFYSRDLDLDFTGLQFTPIISKQVQSQYGLMTPYAGLPISVIGNSKKTVTALQLSVGTELNLEKNRQVGAEFNLNLNDSVTSLVVFFAFPFDSSTGYKK